MNKQYTATENQEQQALFEWAETMANRHPELNLMFHIPNGGKRHIKTAVQLKAEGVKSGVPDICLPVSKGSYHGLFIEMKRKGGKTSGNQDKWLALLSEQGYRACVCIGWEQAAQKIISYLSL